MDTIRCPHCGEQTPLDEDNGHQGREEKSPFTCLNCSKSFGETKPNSPDSAQNQCDTFHFSYGGYFGGFKKLTFREKDGYVELTIDPPYSEFDHSSLTFRTTLDEWHQFKQVLFQELFLLSWTGDYTDPDILDGTQWAIRLEFDRLNTIKLSGSNRYPVYYEQLIEHTEPYFRLVDDMT